MTTIAVAQLNSIVGDFSGNFRKIVRAAAEARRGKADILVLPEMMTTGYPPRDLLERREFWCDNQKVLEQVAKLSRGMAIVLGSIFPASALSMAKHRAGGLPLLHGALLFKGGKQVSAQAKTYLPNTDVFNEPRYFSAAAGHALFPLAPRLKAALTVCEDMWNVPQQEFWSADAQTYYPYNGNLFQTLAALHPQLLINISASPYWRGKFAARISRAQEIAHRYKLPFLYVNTVGANDELIFDGRSFAVSAAGECVWQMAAFEEDVAFLDTKILRGKNPPNPLCQRGNLTLLHRGDSILPPLEKGDRGGFAVLNETEEVRQAISVGIRDYVRKSGFQKVILGLSGGIDSALVAALAVAALGKSRVLAVWLPSPYSSAESEEAARAVAHALGIELRTMAIAAPMAGFQQLLSPWKTKTAAWNVAEENLQARLRGTLLMALANGENRLLLTTGNKSELAVGYCTLYGDMCGALNPIGDLYKTEVYALARHMNRKKSLFSDILLTKAPSAELRPDQRDEDTLPPYDTLDALIKSYMENHHTPEQLVAQGFDRATVDWFVTIFNRQEYKRRQAPPILKLRSRSFGMGWQYPVVKKSPIQM